MGVTPKQAWAIAHLVVELRPEWQPEGVVAAIKKCADRSPVLVALASIRAAADSNVRTPGAIPTAGDHWQEGIKSQARTSFDLPCPEHADQILPCRRCAAARVPAEASNALALARAELQSALSRLCPAHHVPPTHCQSAHTPQPTPAAEAAPEPEETP